MQKVSGRQAQLRFGFGALQRPYVRVFFVVVVGLLGACWAGCHPWCPTQQVQALNARVLQSTTGTDAASHFSLVTFNTYRLKKRARALKQFAMLKRAGTSLGEDAQDPLPDIVLLQELTGKEAIAQFRESFQATHHFQTYACDTKLKEGGVVGVAIKRKRFVLDGTIQRLALGGERVLFDHERCATYVRLHPVGAASDVKLHIIGLHLSYLSSKQRVKQTNRLLALLRDQKGLTGRTLIAGDFNFKRDAPGYKILGKALMDVFPDKSGTTHYMGRFDHVFTGNQLKLVRCLECQIAELAISQNLSDHFPEGGLFFYR